MAIGCVDLGSGRVKNKEAFLPLFFGDFLASTAEWSGEEQSLYLLLLGYQWSGGSLPIEPDRVRRLSRWEKASFESAWATVGSKFEVVDGRLFNLRLEAHRAKTKAIAEKNAENGQKGAANRWHPNGERQSAANSQQIALAIKSPSRSGNGRHKSATTEGVANGMASGDGIRSIPSHPDPATESRKLSKEGATGSKSATGGSAS